MSKSSRNKQRSRKSEPSAADDAAEPTAQPAIGFKPPLRPSRRLFVIAAGLLVVWLGFLLTLYLTAILPEKQREHTDAARPPPTQSEAVAHEAR